MTAPRSLGEIDMVGQRQAFAVSVSPSEPTVTDAIGRAREAWERAGRPGDDGQQLRIGDEPKCSCGGRGICTVCVLAGLERDE